MSCFGEYLAECAADGVDITAPVPLSKRARAKMSRCPARVMADEYTLECGKPADGARGDPATVEKDARATHETKSNPHSI